MKMTSACAAAAAILALTGAASAVSAQDFDVAYNAALGTDYVYRGASQTDSKPAVSGGIDVTAGSFYVGTWASNVKFGDGTDAEIDLYGGYRTEAAGYALDLGVVGYFYVGEPSGSDYEFVEFKAAASRAIGPATVGAAVYYSPDFYGLDDEATYVEVNASYSPADKWTVSGAAGNQWLDVSDDYLNWNAGVAYALSPVLTADLRYYDTDVKGSDLYDARVVASLKTVF